MAPFQLLQRLALEIVHDEERPLAPAGAVDEVAVLHPDDAWVIEAAEGVVTPIDPVDGTVGSPIRVGVDPSDLAVGLDAVWVGNLEDGTISRIDPSTGIADTIPIGSPVAAIAVDESTRSLWTVIARRAF